MTHLRETTTLYSCTVCGALHQSVDGRCDDHPDAPNRAVTVAPVERQAMHERIYARGREAGRDEMRGERDRYREALERLSVSATSHVIRAYIARVLAGEAASLEGSGA